MRGRPKRDRAAERAAAEAALDAWRRTHSVTLTLDQLTRKMAELYWLRLRLGDSEETVDTLDGILEASVPPATDPVS